MLLLVVQVAVSRAGACSAAICSVAVYNSDVWAEKCSPGAGEMQNSINYCVEG